MLIKLDDYITDEKSMSKAINQVCKALSNGDALCLGGRRLEFSTEGCSENFLLIGVNAYLISSYNGCNNFIKMFVP